MTRLGSFSFRGELLGAALFALSYFAGSELGYSLSLGPSVGGTFWPPSGITLAVLLASPTRQWPTLLAAGLAANFISDVLHGQLLTASIGFAATNLGGPILGAILLRRVAGTPITMGRLPELIALAVIVSFVSTPLASALGAWTAQRYTVDPPGFAAGWRTWWVGDAVGALVLTPPVFRILSDWRTWRTVRLLTWLEVIAFGLVLLAVVHFVFSAPSPSLAWPFLAFPVLLWASLRLGVVAVGSGLCLVVVLTAHDTAAGLGPFAAPHLSLGERLIALQVYVGVMALCFHSLALLWEERAKTAAALRHAHSGLEARYRRIVEQSPFAIVALTPEGAIQDVNPAWRQLQHADATAHAPRPDAELAPLIERAFRGEVVALPERALEPPDNGSPARLVRGFAYPVTDEAGHVAEVVIMQRDITDEVRAREQLLAANHALREREEALSDALQQMAVAEAHREHLLEAERAARADAERASMVKDQFLATLSHELRTPLNAIVGWAEILRRRTTEPDTAVAVDTIHRNARAQARLIDDLLDMSRILAGKTGLTLAPANLVEIVASACEALQPEARAKGIVLSVTADGDSDMWVSCDAERLRQVVANLVGNGVKFTGEGGRVDVAVGSAGGVVQIVVRDTGQGIPPEFLPLVFDRFRQVDGLPARQHGGLGLGLSIARQLVELHGGSIAAHSDGHGRGATFTVTLPLAHVSHGTPAPAPEDDQTSAPLAGARVLVVDDHRDGRELLRRLLTEHGCDVTCVASSDQALRRLERGAYDVLLTDIGMPGTDGYELLRRVRAGRAAAIRAVAITAFARPQDKARALAAGFDAYLSKPVDPAELFRVLARAAGTPH